MSTRDQSTKGRRQIPLRISGELYDELMKLAEDEFRSLNGQIEYILTRAVRKRRGGQDPD